MVGQSAQALITTPQKITAQESEALFYKPSPPGAPPHNNTKIIPGRTQRVVRQQYNGGRKPKFTRRKNKKSPKRKTIKKRKVPKRKNKTRRQRK